MKLTPCLSGHLYITKGGRGVHLSPDDLRTLVDFIDRDPTIQKFLPKKKTAMGKNS